MGEVVSRDRLAALAARARAGGQTLAVADGSFELLHVGHVRFLEAAAQEADLLVVAVHGDAAVRERSGDGRPVIDADARAAIVAALRVVDWVVVVPEAAAATLLRALRPEVYCRRTEPAPAERETVAGWGGRVAIVGDPEAPTTAEILARIAESRDG